MRCVMRHARTPKFQLSGPTVHSLYCGFDIINFYPSITLELLTKALDYASKYISITTEERQIIMHAKQSLLFTVETTWTKKDFDGMFHVTMGSYANYARKSAEIKYAFTEMTA